MPNWMVTKNMQIFAEEVMPAFRDADGKPDHLRHEPAAPRTRTELAATKGRPAEAARSMVTGSDHLIDHRVAHLPDVIDDSMRAHDRGAADGKWASAG